MILYDSHMHCSFSTDSDAAPEAQIKAAIELGLKGITFTDHLDPEFPLDPKEFMFDRDEYYRQLSALKEQYKNQIDIRIGVELGMREDQTSLLPLFAKEKPYDFIIGSIHVVDNYDPYFPEYWQDKGTEEGIRRFFEATAVCAEIFDYYDSLGHLDYIYRYAPEDSIDYPIEHYSELIDRILKAIIAKDKALEINTAGWKYGLTYPHPQPYILKRYRELGGYKLTLGSDGHKPEHLAFDFNRVSEYILENGFSGYYRYENRKPRFISASKLKYNLAVFDMDGTILDTIEDLYNATNYALQLNNLPLRTLEEVKWFVGNGILNLVKRAVPENSSNDTIEKVYIDFMQYYPNHCADKTSSYAGINQCIKTLRELGIKTAVVSNKADAAVKILVEEYFPGLFDVAIGENEKAGIRKKPAPDSVFMVLKELGCSASESIYIGDSDVDLATAENSGLECIGVTWGFRGEQFLKEHGASKIAYIPDDIIKLMLSF